MISPSVKELASAQVRPRIVPTGLSLSHRRSGDDISATPSPSPPPSVTSSGGGKSSSSNCKMTNFSIAAIMNNRRNAEEAFDENEIDIKRRKLTLTGIDRFSRGLPIKQQGYDENDTDDNDVDVEQPEDEVESSSSPAPPTKPLAPVGETIKKKKEDKMKMRSKCNCDELRFVECVLETKDLWEKFHDLETEMIITKTGRRMFPTVRCSFTNLRPDLKYWVLLDIVPCDNKRYRYAYHRSSWLVAGKADPPPPARLYPHPDAPYSGEQLRKQVVSFEKVKLTNNEMDKNGQIVLNSMHRYQPRIHLVTRREGATGPIVDLEKENYHTYIYPETVFTAVTAYQNQLITKLKIDSNPFAKGFRDSSRLNDYDSDYYPGFPPPMMSGGLGGMMGAMGFFHSSGGAPMPHPGMLDPQTAALLFRTSPFFAMVNAAAGVPTSMGGPLPPPHPPMSSPDSSEQNNNLMLAAEKARAAMSIMMAQQRGSPPNPTSSSPPSPRTPTATPLARPPANHIGHLPDPQHLQAALLAAHQQQQQQHQSQAAALYGRFPASPPSLFSQWSAMQNHLGLLSSISSTTSSPSLPSPSAPMIVTPRPIFPSVTPSGGGLQRFSPYVLSSSSNSVGRPQIRSTPSPTPSSISLGSERTGSPKPCTPCDLSPTSN